MSEEVWIIAALDGLFLLAVYPWQWDDPAFNYDPALRRCESRASIAERETAPQRAAPASQDDDAQIASFYGEWIDFGAGSAAWGFLAHEDEGQYTEVKVTPEINECLAQKGILNRSTDASIKFGVNKDEHWETACKG